MPDADESSPVNAARRKPGILDVSRTSGFSPTTVSHALNGRGRVSEETRETIREVARRLGYRANPSARKMRGARTGLVGLIARLPVGSTWGVADLEFLVRLERSICDAAIANELYPIILSARGLESAIRTVPLDGAVLVDPLASDDALALLEREGVPVVTLGRDIDRDPDIGWSADNDKRAITARALDELAARGMRRPVLLTADTGQNYMTDVAASFEDWLARHDMHGLVIRFDRPYDPDDCRRRVGALCAQGAVDTIYLGVEVLLQPTLDAVRSSGLRIPEDLQVLMASDGGAARSQRPSISAVDLHPERLGVATLELLRERIEDPALPPAHRRVEADVIHRESSRAPRGATS